MHLSHFSNTVLSNDKERTIAINLYSDRIKTAEQEDPGSPLPMDPPEL